MGTIRGLRSTGFSTYEKHKDTIAWIQPFTRALEKISTFVGGRMGDIQNSRHEEFGDEWFRFGYRRTRCQESNVIKMVELMRRTAHLGAELVADEHICSYAVGEVVLMGDENMEEILISVHEDGRELEGLFETSLFTNRFAKITLDEPNRWLKGKSRGGGQFVP